MNKILKPCPTIPCRGMKHFRLYIPIIRPFTFFQFSSVQLHYLITKLFCACIEAPDLPVLHMVIITH